MEAKINVTMWIIGGIVTIFTSIGGSYMTTKMTLAKHDFEIESLKRVSNENRIILHKIDKAVAVIQERTK